MEQIKLYLKAQARKVKDWVILNRRSLTALAVGFVLGAIIF